MHIISRQAAFVLTAVAAFTAYTLMIAAETHSKAAGQPNMAAIHSGDPGTLRSATNDSALLAREATERHRDEAARFASRSARRPVSGAGGRASFSPIPVDEIFHGPRGTNRVALTFDVETGDGVLPQILDTLKAANVKATFFVLGSWAENHRQLAKRIADEGHEIANHSFSHPALTTMSDECVLSELTATDKSLYSITRRPPSRLFRPPYGNCDERILGLAASKGFKTVLWNGDPGDWRISKTSEEIIGSVMDNIVDGDIVVLHASNAVTGTALPSILEQLDSQGLRQVSVSSLLR